MCDLLGFDLQYRTEQDHKTCLLKYINTTNLGRVFQGIKKTGETNGILHQKSLENVVFTDVFLNTQNSVFKGIGRRKLHFLAQTLPCFFDSGDGNVQNIRDFLRGKIHL